MSSVPYRTWQSSDSNQQFQVKGQNRHVNAQQLESTKNNIAAIIRVKLLKTVSILHLPSAVFQLVANNISYTMSDKQKDFMRSTDKSIYRQTWHVNLPELELLGVSHAALKQEDDWEWNEMLQPWSLVYHLQLQTTSVKSTDVAMPVGRSKDKVVRLRTVEVQCCCKWANDITVCCMSFAYQFPILHFYRS